MLVAKFIALIALACLAAVNAAMAGFSTKIGKKKSATLYFLANGIAVAVLIAKMF